MPTVLRVGGYRFVFYSSNGTEPPHVHVVSAGGAAKLWLAEPVTLARSSGYDARELRALQRLVVTHRDDLERAWHDYFDR